MNAYTVFPLVGAYGRDYKDEASVLADWDAGKDFKTANGQYCSKRDFYPGLHVTVRYNKLSQVMVIATAAEDLEN